MGQKMGAPGVNRAQVVYLNNYLKSGYMSSKVVISNCTGCGTHYEAARLVDGLCAECFAFRKKALGLAQASC